MERDSTYFLTLMEKYRIEPNFWAAEEYFHKARFQLNNKEDVYWVTDGEWIVFVPISNQFRTLSCHGIEGKIWSDFFNHTFLFTIRTKELLDEEYLYNPRSFLHMDGNQWAVFRKNCRKWKRRIWEEGVRPIYRPVLERDNLNSVLIDWLKSDLDRVIEDDEILVKYLNSGKNRKVIADQESGKIYAINIWDENYMYINYRYCICRNEPFLSEFARYSFYTDPEILSKGKLVNDGGILGSDSLKKFKDKMNPIRVRSVYSWI